LLRLLSLVQNENMKIYRRWRTWIMLGILVALIITGVTVTKIDTPPDANVEWQTKLQKEIEGNERVLNDPQAKPSGEYKEYLEKNIKLNKHAIEKGYDTTQDTLWNIVMGSSEFIVLVSIFTIVVASDIVAGEFSTGTIKMLLIRPVRRWKILLSKYIATFGFAMVALIVLFLSAFLSGLVAFGTGGADIPHLFVASDGSVKEVSMLVHALQSYGYGCVTLIMMVTFAFMISSVFRSSSMAIGISLGLLFMGNIVVEILGKYNWIKYWLFTNTYLEQYLNDNPIVEGMTLGFSLTMLAIYFIAFMALAWTLFTKRDVAA